MVQDSKKNFVGLQTLKCGVFDSLLLYNLMRRTRTELRLWKNWDSSWGKNCLKIITDIDKNRVKKSDKASTLEAKQARKQSRMAKKKYLDVEEQKKPEYETGMF